MGRWNWVPQSVCILLSGYGALSFLERILGLPGTIDDAKTWWGVLTMHDLTWLFIPLFLINILWIAAPLWYPRLTGVTKFKALTPQIDDLLRLGMPGPNFERDAKALALNHRLETLNIPHPNLMLREDSENSDTVIVWVMFLISLRAYADLGELEAARKLYGKIRSSGLKVSP